MSSSLVSPVVGVCGCGGVGGFSWMKVLWVDVGTGVCDGHCLSSSTALFIFSSSLLIFCFLPFSQIHRPLPDGVLRWGGGGLLWICVVGVDVLVL